MNFCGFFLVSLHDTIKEIIGRKIFRKMKPVLFRFVEFFPIINQTIATYIPQNNHVRIGVIFIVDINVLLFILYNKVIDANIIYILPAASIGRNRVLISGQSTT